MKSATGLTLVAIGAILTFAVTTNTSVFNLHIAGVVIMLTGLVGLLIPRRTYASLSRRLVQRRTRTWPNGQVVETKETSYPPYVMTNPGAAAEQAGLPSVPSIPPDPNLQSVRTKEDAEPERGPRRHHEPGRDDRPAARRVGTADADTIGVRYKGSPSCLS